jgi:transposase InsO family protein
MRFTQAQKYEIIRLVEGSELSVRRTLDELGIKRSTFYRWYARYLESGYDGLARKQQKPRKAWNEIPDKRKQEVIELALEEPALSPREVAWTMVDRRGYYISESSVYRLLKARWLVTSPAFVLIRAADTFHRPTERVNQLWQTNFTYFKIVHWGWFYLSTILDDYSRYIVTWKLCSTMAATDVEHTLEMALDRQAIPLKNRPQLLSDNGPCYISQHLADYLKAQRMTHIRGRPHHPQTQGKIERYHRSMKNIVKLEHYYSPEHLEQAIGDFVDYYNHERYHEALDNMRPADVYFGKAESIRKKRATIKPKTMQQRRKTWRREILKI